MRVYVVGPPTDGTDPDQVDEWAAALRCIELAGHVPTTACQILFAECELTLRESLEADVLELLEADMVACLPGWEDSPGSVMDVALATALGMLVHQVETPPKELLVRRLAEYATAV